jgi:hypothetical protein
VPVAVGDGIQLGRQCVQTALPLVVGPRQSSQPLSAVGTEKVIELLRLLWRNRSVPCGRMRKSMQGQGPFLSVTPEQHHCSLTSKPHCSHTRGMLSRRPNAADSNLCVSTLMEMELQSFPTHPVGIPSLKPRENEGVTCMAAAGGAQSCEMSSVAAFDLRLGVSGPQGFSCHRATVFSQRRRRTDRRTRGSAYGPQHHSAPRLHRRGRSGG